MVHAYDAILALLLIVSGWVAIAAVRLQRENVQLRKELDKVLQRALADLRSGDEAKIMEACQIIGQFGARQKGEARERLLKALGELSMSDSRYVARQANVAFGRFMDA